MKIELRDITTHHSYDKKKNFSKFFIILEHNNDSFIVYLNKVFILENATKDENQLIINAVGYLSMTINPHSKSFFNGMYSNKANDYYLNLFEQKLFDNLEKEYDLPLNNDVRVFLLGSRDINDSLFDEDIFDNIYEFEDNEDENTFIKKNIIEKLCEIRNRCNTKNTIDKNGNISFLETFSCLKSNTEMVGYFFELICQFILFKNNDYYFRADWTAINATNSSGLRREEDNIYPDIIGLNKNKKEILIIDAKLYSNPNQVKVKEVLMNSIVITDLVENIKPFPKVYNLAFVPQNLSVPFRIHKIFEIYENNVIIVELDIFKIAKSSNIIKELLFEVDKFKNDNKDNQELIHKYKFDSKKKEWIKKYLTY